MLLCTNILQQPSGRAHQNSAILPHCSPTNLHLIFWKAELMSSLPARRHGSCRPALILLTKEKNKLYCRESKLHRVWHFRAFYSKAYLFWDFVNGLFIPACLFWSDVREALGVLFLSSWKNANNATTVESQKPFNPKHERVSSVACGNEVRPFKPGLGLLSGKWTAFTWACLERAALVTVFFFNDPFIFYQRLPELRWCSSVEFCSRKYRSMHLLVCQIN